jgi:hypothetical protein
MGKQTLNFADQAAADAWLANFRANLKTVAGDSAVSVVIDDRTLDQAKVERKAAMLLAAQSAWSSFSDTYDAIKSRLDTANAAIDAATTNDAVDAVNF